MFGTNRRHIRLLTTKKQTMNNAYALFIRRARCSRMSKHSLVRYRHPPHNIMLNIVLSKTFSFKQRSAYRANDALGDKLSTSSDTDPVVETNRRHTTPHYKNQTTNNADALFVRGARCSGMSKHSLLRYRHPLHNYVEHRTTKYLHIQAPKCIPG